MEGWGGKNHHSPSREREEHPERRRTGERQTDIQNTQDLMIQGLSQEIDTNENKSHYKE